MSRITTAVVLLEPLSDGYFTLFNRALAGVTILRRLVFALGRAGIRRIIVLARDPEDRPEFRHQYTSLRDDPRRRGELEWTTADAFFSDPQWQHKLAAEGEAVLVAGAGVVTTPHLLRDFLARAIERLEGGRPAVSLSPAKRQGIHLLAVHHVALLRDWAYDGGPEPTGEYHPPPERFAYWSVVFHPREIPAVESALIRQYKHHYTQLMDVWFNSLFSLRISRWLVRTPLTPNQLTLAGLLIGLAAGWMFARGDYLGGALGGLLAAFTAVWDCCDGDVARLKFMESDFGEYLDTLCDNIINILVFGGMAIGVARAQGWEAAVTPFLLLAAGGTLVFCLIYFPRGSGKGGGFKGTPMYDVILLLASRNFIYVIVAFALAGHIDWFLWIAGYGSLAFALVLFIAKRKMAYLPG